MWERGYKVAKIWCAAQLQCMVLVRAERTERGGAGLQDRSGSGYEVVKDGLEATNWDASYKYMSKF